MINLETHINAEIFKFILRNFYEQLVACVTVDELCFNKAYIAISCKRLSIEGTSNQDGVVIAREAARILKIQIEAQKL